MQQSFNESGLSGLYKDVYKYCLVYKYKLWKSLPVAFSTVTVMFLAVCQNSLCVSAKGNHQKLIILWIVCVSVSSLISSACADNN